MLSPQNTHNRHTVNRKTDEMKQITTTTTMETRYAKRKKKLLLMMKNAADHHHHECQQQDHISELPDAVLHHILVLLPIKSIAQTSMLSKRWKHLWYSFPDLDFTTVDTEILDNSSLYNVSSSGGKRVRNNDQTTGIDFITRVLALRDKRCSDVRMLRFRARLSFSRLNGLIRRAVIHNVQELDIEVATADYFNFPRSVIGSESLRVFKLKSWRPGFRLPPSGVLKSGFRFLHTLSLSLVVAYEQASLLDLFTDSSFPLLKKMTLDTCSGLKHLGFMCRGIEELNLENCLELEDLDICCPKLARLKVTSCFDACSSNSWLKIDAPRLGSIFWAYNAITDSCSLVNLTCLDEVSIGIFVPHELKIISSPKLCSISNFLAGLSHTKCLALESQCIEILSKYNHFAGVIVQPFMNLKTLELRTTSIPELANLFRSFHTLHTLIIKIATTNDSKAERRPWIKDLWESCSREEQFWESQTQALKPFLSHLKIVKINGFSECKDNISLIKFLLKQVRVLQEMILCSGDNNISRGSLRHEKIKSQIVGFARASSNAKISFE